MNCLSKIVALRSQPLDPAAVAGAQGQRLERAHRRGRRRRSAREERRWPLCRGAQLAGHGERDDDDWRGGRGGEPAGRGRLHRGPALLAIAARNIAAASVLCDAGADGRRVGDRTLPMAVERDGGFAKSCAAGVADAQALYRSDRSGEEASGRSGRASVGGRSRVHPRRDARDSGGRTALAAAEARNRSAPRCSPTGAPTRCRARPSSQSGDVLNVYI